MIILVSWNKQTSTFQSCHVVSLNFEITCKMVLSYLNVFQAQPIKLAKERRTLIKSPKSTFVHASLTKGHWSINDLMHNLYI